MSSLSIDFYLLYDAIFKWLQWALMNKSMWYNAAQVFRNNLVMFKLLPLKNWALVVMVVVLVFVPTFLLLAKVVFYNSFHTNSGLYSFVYGELCPLSGKMVITSAKMYLKLLTCIHLQNVGLYRLVYNLC